MGKGVEKRSHCTHGSSDICYIVQVVLDLLTARITRVYHQPQVGLKYFLYDTYLLMIKDEELIIIRCEDI